MASAAHTSPECDYLHSHTSPIPHVFTSEQAELVHINEQISSLDNHTSQPNSNLLSPIYSLPIEVLSHIFQHTTTREYHDFSKLNEYGTCLRQAFILSSVSTLFRHVAFYTPELWRRIPLEITAGTSIDRLSSLLRRCMTLAPSVDVSVYDKLNEEKACSAIETLLTPEVTRRIKTFEIISRCALDVWITKLKGSSSSMLVKLGIFCKQVEHDLRTLSTVTRLELHDLDSDGLTIMPPSVRYLFLDHVRPQAFVSMLYHCPNLEECVAYERVLWHGGNPVARFDRPLTLPHLKRLTFHFVDVIMTPSSVQNLRLPSLEYLRFQHYGAGNFDGFLLLCQSVSTTLTTLKIELFTGEALAYDDDLYQLCRLPFSNLKKLQFTSHSLEPIRSIVRALTRGAKGWSDGDTESHCLPSLTTLTFKLGFFIFGPAHRLVILLDKWRVGETSYFHLKIKTPFHSEDRNRSPEVEEELRSVVGSRQIGITWNGRKVH